MMPNPAPHRRLPVVLPPAADELLSSWISRHAAFYSVPPIIMLRHCLPEASSLRAADLYLSDDQARRLSEMFASVPDDVRRMTFTNVVQTSRRLIAARPLQSCKDCMFGTGEPAAIMRSQLLGWRITCSLCGGLLRDSGDCDIPSPFHQHRRAALQGETLLDAEAEREIRTWASPIDIALLLLMRRVPRPVPSEKELWRFRVLGAIVPELDNIVAARPKNLSTPANPILPLHMRPALLAGVAIVACAGPEMLQLLHSHTVGENRTRFSNLADTIVAQTSRPRAPSQLQLI